MKIEDIDQNMRPTVVPKGDTRWMQPFEAPLRLSGFAWFAQDRVYRRLPVASQWPIREDVDCLANHTAGGQVQFQTDSGKLSIHVKLKGPAGMGHMPATGQCGFDVYLGPAKAQRFCSVTKYDHTQAEYEVALFDLEQEMRHVTLNFPLYQGVDEVSIGFDAKARVLPPLPFDDPRPVVVYGTSITQGGCASRPGMAYTNILSRRFNRPFVNVGFSGNGRGEPEVAHLLAEIRNPGCYVLDYEANAATELRLQKTLRAFIQILKSAHPAVPVVVVSSPRFTSDLFQPTMERSRLERLGFQQKTVTELTAEGVLGLHFVDAGYSQGIEFDECTVDGVHPNDLGFWRMSKFLHAALAPILGR